MRACGVLAPLTLVSRPEVAQLERDVAKESPRPFFFFSALRTARGGRDGSSSQAGDEQR